MRSHIEERPNCLDFAGFSHIPCIQSGVLTFIDVDFQFIQDRISRCIWCFESFYKTRFSIIIFGNKADIFYSYLLKSFFPVAGLVTLEASQTRIYFVPLLLAISRYMIILRNIWKWRNENISISRRFCEGVSETGRFCYFRTVWAKQDPGRGSICSSG